MLKLHNIPVDINAELIFDWLPEGSFRMSLRGQHKRNAYNDLVEIEKLSDDTFVFHLGRNGMYNTLPESMFHPLDRFSNLPPYEEKERFAREMAKQEQEKENAVRFFEPMDLQLMLYRVLVREKLRHVTETDSVLIDIIADRLTDSQKQNRFIKRTLPFLSACRDIRGNKTLLTQMIRKVMLDEGMRVTPKNDSLLWSDETPRYADSLGDDLGDTFLGNVYDEEAVVFEIRYWPETVDAQFPSLVQELDEYRRFVCDFFLSVEAVLSFRVYSDRDEIILGEEDVFNYLNYNTNI